MYSCWKMIYGNRLENQSTHINILKLATLKKEYLNKICFSHFIYIIFFFTSCTTRCNIGLVHSSQNEEQRMWMNEKIECLCRFQKHEIRQNIRFRQFQSYNNEIYVLLSWKCLPSGYYRSCFVSFLNRLFFFVYSSKLWNDVMRQPAGISCNEKHATSRWRK